MSESFGLVEQKILEADFFLKAFSNTKRLDYSANYYFSAFVSAARSVTFALQANMNDVEGFLEWYEQARAKLRTDPLAPFFVEVRNDLVHTGKTSLNALPINRLREILFSPDTKNHFMIFPNLNENEDGMVVNAVSASCAYFTSLVSLIYECYETFKSIVDPQWYFTKKNFQSHGKSFDDAIQELGFPPGWASCAPDEEMGWKIIRRQQPPCALNELFQEYLRKQIADPDR
ncbi:MAG: hypothetical protein PHS57_09630 [Alphaproteobacteria bacterium]|nr:hypothetical protein [Alphaproteobacteria bacterium]